jgi:hypothetical protein
MPFERKGALKCNGNGSGGSSSSRSSCGKIAGAVSSSRPTPAKRVRFRATSKLTIIYDDNKFKHCAVSTVKRKQGKIGDKCIKLPIDFRMRVRRGESTGEQLLPMPSLDHFGLVD